MICPECGKRWPDDAKEKIEVDKCLNYKSNFKQCECHKKIPTVKNGKERKACARCGFCCKCVKHHQEHGGPPHCLRKKFEKLFFQILDGEILLDNKWMYGLRQLAIKKYNIKKKDDIHEVF